VRRSRRPTVRRRPRRVFGRPSNATHGRVPQALGGHIPNAIANEATGRRTARCVLGRRELAVIPYQNADVAVPKCGYVRYPLYVSS
jgi:hypothetical protein